MSQSSQQPGRPLHHQPADGAVFIGTAVCLLLLIVTGAPVQAMPQLSPKPSPTLVYAQHPCTQVLSAASASAALVTDLLGGTDVTYVGPTTATDGTAWDHVKIWSGIDGYIRAADAGTQPPPDSQLGGEESCPPFTPGVDEAGGSGPWPLFVQAAFIAPSVLLSSPSLTGFPTGEVTQGAKASINQWTADGDGTPWYHVTTGSAAGWAPVSRLRLDMPDPASYTVNGKPVWQPIVGKGMWLKNYAPHHSDMNAMVQAAKLAGITHVYTEVAISGAGFYARDTLNRLLPVAHQNGISVIATVFPTLQDVSADIRLAAEVAQYQAPTGDHVDGIAMDIETVTDSQAVYDYGQVVRAALGPNVVMVANVYHPQNFANYPYDAIAVSWNVISPMDFWHLPSRTYTAADTRAFVSTSVVTLRAAVGPKLPIEELGQMYDMSKDPYGSLGGTAAPSTAEIVADIQTARQLGCIGVTFFTWQTATQAQWQALVATPW